MLSAICDPPKPRLMTGSSGKSLARVVQSRMLELPTNNTPPEVGPCLASAASKARISFSNGLSAGEGASAARTALDGHAASSAMTIAAQQQQRRLAGCMPQL